MMKRFAFACLFIAVFALAAFAEETTAAAPQTKTFGKAPTLTEVVTIAKLNSAPEELTNKKVLLTGKIVDMCRHSGCWVEVEAADSSRIICKSMDESIHFTTDCIGKDVSLQGKLLVDRKAPGSEKKGSGETAHSCPAPQVMVSIDGATVNMSAAAAPAATPTEGSK